MPDPGRLRPLWTTQGNGVGAFPISNLQSAITKGLFPSPAPFAILFSLPDNCEVWKGTPMGARRIRREQRQVDMAQSRHRNGILKDKERLRRAKRMTEIIKKGKLPYTPAVMSWLSSQTGKPSRLLTQADVDRLFK